MTSIKSSPPKKLSPATAHTAKASISIVEMKSWDETPNIYYRIKKRETNRVFYLLTSQKTYHLNHYLNDIALKTSLFENFMILLKIFHFIIKTLSLFQKVSFH